MSTVYLTVGIPASGKSTWARDNAADLNAAIVCRDDIRLMQGLKHGENEDLVTVVEHALIEGLILEGKNVIVADTNVNKTFRNRLIRFCHQRGADVEVVVFEIGLDEAILRDSARVAKVGADVIRKMYDGLSGQLLELNLNPTLPVPSYEPYVHGTGTHYRPEAIVVDIDGTVAEHWNRSPFEFSKVGDDRPIQDVINIITSLSQDYMVVFVSGRDDSCFDETSEWILAHLGLTVGEDCELHMRVSKDQRPDYIIKNEIYDAKVIPRFNITMVFDDREQVITHLRRRGITVAQVAPGRF